jgi:hypothetical protein
VRLYVASTLQSCGDMETYVKLCPDCRIATALQAVRCHQCGHVYRTRFDSATGQVVPGSPASSAPPRVAAIGMLLEWARMAFRLLRLLAIYAGPLAIVLGMNLHSDSPTAPVLLPFLVLMVLVWLWYLSDSQ